jgi:hypothetical protein
MKNSRVSKASVSHYERLANANEMFLGFEGIQDADNQLYMASGAGSAKSTEPYTISVTNAHATEAQDAIIFGQNLYGNVSNFGSGANITIANTSGFSYFQLLTQSAFQPFEVVKMRITSTNIAQLDVPFTLSKADADGRAETTPINTTSYLSPNQNQNNIRDIDRNFTVDGSTFLRYRVFALTTVTMAFYIAAKVNTVRPIVGKAAIEEFNAVRVRSFK